jgi:hypothetical protein
LLPQILEELTVPRISFDDKLDCDPRFKAFVRIVGSEDVAFGRLLRFWRLAAQFWGQGMLVPKEDFDREGIVGLIESGLAEIREGGAIYARGSQRFDWLRHLKARASAAGKKSAASRQAKETTTQPKRRRVRGGVQHSEATMADDGNQMATECQPGANQVATECQPSSTICSKFYVLGSNVLGSNSTPPPSEEGTRPKHRPTAGTLLQEHFTSVYRRAYGFDPVLRKASANKHAKDIVDALGGETQGGLEKAKLYVEAYLSMRDDWFLKRRHEFLDIQANLNAIAGFIANGRQMTSVKVRQIVREVQGDDEAEQFIKKIGLNRGDVIDASSND